VRRWTAFAAVLAAAGCGAGTEHALPGGGDAGRGKELIREYGCGACHTIGGIQGADATVGPPLMHFKDKETLAGKLPNTPKDAIRWIVDPQRYVPGNDMPDLGIENDGARDIVAYLYGQ
jgi:cytochrome c2